MQDGLQLIGIMPLPIGGCDATRRLSEVVRLAVGGNYYDLLIPM
jgi:hypothetical protein